jgi:hypothetical protein
VLGDAAFRERCAAGHRVEAQVAAWFRGAGLEVREGAKRIRSDFSSVEAGEYHNEFDLLVAGQRIEVRGRPKLRFGLHPQSFPLDPVYVDQVRVFDRKNPRPLAYVFHSGVTGALLAVRTDVLVELEVVPVFKRIEQHWREYYALPRNELRSFRALAQYLKRTP